MGKKEANKRYYEKNKERLRREARERYRRKTEEEREAILRRSRRRYVTDEKYRENMKERGREYYRKHRAEIAAKSATPESREKRRRYNREYRRRNREALNKKSVLRDAAADGKLKRHARYVVRKAVDDGRLSKPESCEVCGANGLMIVAHHNSYDESKLLEVVWVCRPCHRAIHRR